MKKIIAFALSIVLLLGVLPLSASATEENFENYEECIYDALYNMKETADLSEYNVDFAEVEKYLSFIFNQHPEIYYLTSASMVSQTGLLEFSYSIEKEQMLAERKFVEEQTSPVINRIKPEWTDTQKALFIHDWLVANFMYDYRLYEYEGKENHDIYGFLRDGIGVCQSYAYTFMYMARKVGLESYLVISPEKDTDGDGIADVAGHGWNVVKIDGNWYHVDATYDDPILGQSFKYDFVGEVSHSKFLLSDEQIRTDLNHYDYFVPCVEEEIVCEEYTGADLWRNATSAVLEINGYWYYLDPNGHNGGLKKTKDFVTAERVCELGYYYDKWDRYAWQVGNYLHDGYFTGLFEYNEHLFFSDSTKIYVYDSHHDKINALPIELPEGNYYFGLNMNGKTITYITSRKSIAENVVQGSYTLNGHSLVTEWEVVKEATDGEDGLKIKRCYFCGEIVQSQTIPALNQLKKGDVDGNGTVNASDLAYLKLFLAGSGIEVGSAADYNGDGEVNATDLAYLKLHLAGA